MDKGSPRAETSCERRYRRSTKTAKTKVAKQRENDEERSPLSLWAKLRAISSPSRDTKPVNALCHAVAGPHVAQPTCESNLSRVLPMISMGMFRLAHGDVVPTPVSCENNVGRRVGLKHR